jgi:amino acid adenylation domain-containing protein
MENVSESQFSSAIGQIEASVATSSSQREIWGSIELDSNANKCYNESVRLFLKGSLNIQALRDAITRVIQRHDALRGCFSQNGLEFIIFKNVNADLQFTDLSSLERNEREHRINNEIVRSTQIEFDLFNGPLFKWHLVVKDEKEAILFFTAHHLVCDGWSLAVILNELSLLYEEFAYDKPAELNYPKQFIQYAATEEIKGLDYWINELTPLPNEIEYPLDRTRRELRSYDSHRIDYQLKPELVQKIQKRAQKLRVSYYQYLFSAFKLLLYKATKNNDFVVGISSASQSSLALYDLVGHLVQLLPIRNKMNDSMSYIELLNNVKSKMLDARDHDQATFGEILKALKINRDPSKIPLVNIIFNVDQQYPGQGLEFSELNAHYESNPRHYENFEIFINATTLKDKCILECQYNIHLYDKETISEMLISYEKLLELIIENEDSKLLDLNVSFKEREAKHTRSDEKVEADVSVKLEDIKYLKDLWESLLNVKVNEDDNFFGLGGHSLLAVELIQKIKQDKNIKLSLKDLFLNPKLHQFARVYQTKVPLNEENTQKYESDNLSFSQRQTWFLKEMNPKTNMHNLPSAIRVNTKINSEKLKQAYKSILEKHPLLRVHIDRTPKLVVNTLDQVLDRLDLSIYKMNESEAVKDMHFISQKGIDYHKAPLFIVKIYQLGENEFILFNLFDHIIFDGWCFDIFFDELNKAYVGEELGREKATYFNHVATEELYLKSEKFQDDLNVFCQKIDNFPKISDFPTDYKRPTIMSHKAQTLTFNFDSTQIKELFEWSKENNISLFTYFLTHFQKTLMEWANIDQLVTGIPLRARDSLDYNETIGYFVNSLPICATHSNLAEMLTEIQTEVTKAIDFQMIPLEQVISKLKIRRDTSRSALFQSFFSFQDVNNRKGLFDNKAYSQVNIDKASTHTDIDMWIKASHKKIEGAIEFRSDLFKPETIQQLLDKFLKSVLDYKTEVNEKVGSKDQEDFYSKINNTFHDAFKFKNIYEYILDQDQNSVALIKDDGQLTYGQLDLRVNQICNTLKKFGVSEGDLVGLCTHRDEFMLEALLAIIKMGATYVPLDPYFPDDRLHYMVEHSSLKTIVLHDDLKNKFKSFNLSFIDQNDIVNTNELFPTSAYSKTSSQYIIYTSGSTGKPKGVELGCESVVNFLLSMQKTLNIQSSHKLLAVTTLSFDISVLELLLPLISGASLYIANKAESFDPESLIDIIKSKKINMMQATPTTWKLMLASNWKIPQAFKILCGGEPFPQELAYRLLDQTSDVWNMYGPTETTVWSTCKKLKRTDQKISIGLPIDNSSIYIMDKNLNSCAIGVVGDLFIGGLGLAKGYYKREDLTQEVFLRHPQTGERIYNTGDLARINDQLEIECLGRSDGQVKIRGYRIELGEIENQLGLLSEVKEVAVKVFDIAGDKKICAFITVHGDYVESTLRAELSKNLPSYMIPQKFITLEKMPLTLNGKIDKKELFYEQAQAKEQGTTNKDRLKSIWKEVLDIEEINETDNFFDLGGHSLLALELFTRLQAEFNKELRLKDIVELERFDKIYDYLFLDKKKVSHIPVLCRNLVSLGEVDPNREFVFCIHGVGGDVMNYKQIVRENTQYNFIGVRANGIDGFEVMPNSLMEMAKLYAEQIHLMQASGDIILVGGSLGGTVAIEVAIALEALGRVVKSVIMLDTFGPNVTYDKDTKNVTFFKDLLDSFKWRSRAIFVYLQSIVFLALGKELPISARYFRIEMHNYRLLNKYQNSQYNNRVDLIRAKKTKIGAYSDENLGWSGVLTGEFNMYEIAAVHDNFIEAKELNDEFNKVLSSLS